MTGQKFIASWSGGKDSSYAFHLACANGGKPVALLTMLDETGEHSRSHRLSTDLLLTQAERLSLPLFIGSATWAAYEEEFVKRLIQARDQCQATAVVFGDIDIAGHREWGEQICSRPDVNLTPIFPLWGYDRRIAVNNMLAAGQEAMIVSCNAKLGETFLGRMLNEKTIAEMEDLGIDICGENGEFHTMVLDCERFSSSIHVSLGERCQQPTSPDAPPSEGYWFIDVKSQ